MISTELEAKILRLYHVEKWKIGTISAQCLARVMSNRFYPSDKEFLLALCDVLNEELRALARKWLSFRTANTTPAPTAIVPHPRNIVREAARKIDLLGRRKTRTH